MRILTIDFGTTVTKVGIWSEDGLVALTRSEVPTAHPDVGWAEQDPLRWWTSVVIACAEARAQAPEDFNQVGVVSCSGARQTFVPVTRAGEPIGKGILWSDRRGASEAAELTAVMGGEDINRPAPASLSMPGRWRPRWPGWRPMSPDVLKTVTPSWRPATSWSCA